MDSCQPEQSIEPDFELSNSLTPQDTEETNDSPGRSATSTQSKKRKLFVPIHETTKVKRREQSLQNTLSAINEALANDPTKDLITFLKEESRNRSFHRRTHTFVLSRWIYFH